jgi:hypothetical protein
MQMKVTKRRIPRPAENLLYAECMLRFPSYGMFRGVGSVIAWAVDQLPVS